MRACQLSVVIDYQLWSITTDKPLCHINLHQFTGPPIGPMQSQLTAGTVFLQTKSIAFHKID